MSLNNALKIQFFKLKNVWHIFGTVGTLF